MKKKVRKNKKVRCDKVRVDTKMTGALTLKQERFAKEYVKHGNATKAVRDAGYNGSNGDHAVIGFENVRKTNIQERITQLNEDREVRTQVTSDRVATELARVGFADPSIIAAKAAASKNLVDFLKSLTADDVAAIDRAYEVIIPGKLETETTKATPTRTEVHYTLHSKIKALEMLAKIQGQFITRISHTDDTPRVSAMRVDDLGLPTKIREKVLTAMRAAKEKVKEDDG